MRKSLLALATVASLSFGTAAHAAIDVYAASLFGSNEVGGGDTDGFGAATLLIDNIANTASWSILVNNIGAVSGAHIHSAPAGSNGSIIVNFNGQLSGSGLADPDLASINPATAANFYFNVHTASFPGGAVRGQLEYVMTVVPEPSSAALLLAGAGVLGFVGRRRRA